MQNYLNQLLIWLQQPVAMFWPVAITLLLLLLLLIIHLRASRKALRLIEQRDALTLERVGHTQRLEQLESDKQRADAHALETSERLQQLISQTSELKTSRDEKLAQIETLRNELQRSQENLELARQKANRLESDVRAQSTQLRAEQDKLNELKQQFELQKTALKTEFKVVSEEIIKERQLALSEQNREGVGALLKPLKDQLEGFQARVNQVHDESLRGNAKLRAEIENVQKMGIALQDEASNLSKALKGDSQQRGAWGEAQLERTLQLSGLVPNDHYQKQNSFTDDSGKRKQTDYVVKLPDDKCIIIDSKVSLVDYERACASEPEHETAAMAMHVHAVRKHIDDLASKEYNNLNELHSPDFILMFMPIEPAYIEAMKHDPELFAYGYTRNVILVSHTTLVPILRTVANLWMLDRSNKEARSLGEKASEIYNSVATVSERLLKLGKTLNTASNHYNDTVKSVAGVQGLQGKVARFNELSNKANKTMPSLENKHIEFETSKLDAQALPELDKPNEPKPEHE